MICEDVLNGTLYIRGIFLYLFEILRIYVIFVRQRVPHLSVHSGSSSVALRPLLSFRFLSVAISLGPWWPAVPFERIGIGFNAPTGRSGTFIIVKTYITPIQEKRLTVILKYAAVNLAPKCKALFQSTISRFIITSLLYAECIYTYFWRSTKIHRTRFYSKRARLPLLICPFKTHPRVKSAFRILRSDLHAYDRMERGICIQ